ncbi:MAG TPA: S8 family peptidase [Acidimicrobiales bacterium]|nr:S8 family peptidase [Acidimicrobiales bacterium]
MTGAGTTNLHRRSGAAFLAACMAVASFALPSLRAGGSTGAASAVRAAAVSVDSALTGIRSGLVRIIVQKQPAAAHTGQPERAVRRAGGTVTRDLSIINGFSATVPAGSIGTLAGTAGVRVISLDHKVNVQANSPQSSPVRSVYRRSVRADLVNYAGYTGKGVTVALIDTGVSAVPDVAGRLVNVTDDLTGAVTPCVNMTNESTCDDSFGHGTFVAGLIAGNGAASNGNWKGVAPAADILSVKIAGRSGAADVSSVIAALQWVVSFRDRYDIRVLNLSLGTDSTQSYMVDPLNYAVERAWSAGIVVVVSASNRGPAPRTISKPGDDPFVITVGAVDDRGTNSINDDLLPNFTSHGPTAADGLAKPDIVAPGAHMVSLRAPGSAVDTEFPNYIDGSYRKGSGTSFSTGVVSGVAALMVQQNPNIVPDRVKFALTSTARSAASTDVMAVGSGEIDAYRATFSAPPGLANQGVPRSTGTGSLDASRGSVQFQADDPLSTVVQGMMTAQLLLWDPVGFLTGDWTGGQWYGGQWYGGQWYGGQWYGGQWYGGQWYGGQWYGQLDGGQWYGGQWYGSAWYGSWE